MIPAARNKTPLKTYRYGIKGILLISNYVNMKDFFCFTNGIFNNVCTIIMMLLYSS